MSCRIGVDTGGTHTDLVLVNEAQDEVFTLKVPTTAYDNSVGVIEGVHKILALADLSPAEVSRFAYGTTVVTNLLIQRNADIRIALVTTKGFRDALEIQRGSRGEHVFDVSWKQQAPLVSRQMRFEIAERVDSDGTVLLPPEEGEVEELCEKLRALAVHGVVVGFINSYVNPAHEQRVGALIAAACPDADVTLSSDISRQFREYERTSTAAINAYVKRPLAAHLDSLSSSLDAIGVAAAPYIMRANGGLMTFTAASRLPVAITHSGPTAGIMAGLAIGAASGIDNLITFDMGGTSSDVSLIRGGRPLLTNRGAIEGWPVCLPMLDLVTVGAGGGTIAWLDPARSLKVGPLSAGSSPGPACYGQGGVEATITDCNLLLGRLNPHFLLGGARRLDAGLARSAIAAGVAGPLGLQLPDAALGIIAIAESHMVNAVKQISVRRGLDPRDFHLVAFGGAGPLHALAIAGQLDIPNVLIPAAPGNFSAMGQLAGNIRHDFALTRISQLDPDQFDDINAEFARMASEGDELLERDGIAAPERIFAGSLDLCYWGQSHELSIPVALPLTADSVGDIGDRFHAEHRRNFGFDHHDRPIKCVHLRLSAVGRLPTLRMKRYGPASRPAEPSHRRSVILADGTSQGMPVYSFDDLAPGHSIREPAIVEYSGSTLFVQPGWAVEFDERMTAHATLTAQRSEQQP